MASNNKEKVIIIANDPVITDLIGTQALQPLGYRIQIASETATALSQVSQFAPDVAIIDLNIPGLSGKDFMVAISAQGLGIPVIIVSRKGQEGDIIQAFRLGATDYLQWPVRETEVVTAIERVLKQVRERRERDRMAQQLSLTNQELQGCLRELTTVFAIGKSIISIPEQRGMFDRLVEGSVRVSQADIGWFVLRDEALKGFILVAQRGLPPSFSIRVNQPWDDGVSGLIAMSGEPLSIHGEPLKRFNIASLGQAALIIPIKVQKRVVGLLSVMRKQPKPFSPSDQSLLNTISEFASISLVNLRLYRSLEERSRQAPQAPLSGEQGKKIKSDMFAVSSQEVGFLAHTGLDLLNQLPNTSPAELRQGLKFLRDLLHEQERVADGLAGLSRFDQVAVSPPANLNETVHLIISRIQPYIKPYDIVLAPNLANEPVGAKADMALMILVIESLLAAAIKFSPPGTQIVIQTTVTPERFPCVSIVMKGVVIKIQRPERLFEPGYRIENQPVYHFGGLGISLSTAKEIILALGGKVWIESRPGFGTAFIITLPPER